MCLGIPGRIVEVHEDRGLPMGVVDFGGVQREVCLAYIADGLSVGDYAIVHVGFAISRVDEAEAKRTFEVLREMSELDELDWMRTLAENAEAVAAEKVPKKGIPDSNSNPQPVPAGVPVSASDTRQGATP